MNISSVTPNMSAAQLHNEISVAVLSKSLDFLENVGDGMQKIMEASVTPNLGQNIDIKL